MPHPLLPTLSLLAGLGAMDAVAEPVPAAPLAHAQLRAINHRFVDAFVVPNPAYLSALVDRDFLRTRADGTWEQREDFLAGLARQDSYASVSYDQVQVRLYGPVAVVHALFEGRKRGGELARARYTDVYVWSDSAWRLVSGQNTVLKEGVPAALQSGSAPLPAPWPGSDPPGEDEAVLRALNDNYVKAFREADVAWYDAHLAPDYLVVSSDGSLKDRGAALADFAKPVFAEHMRSFPVHKVNIRRFGDLALIHAENDFEMKDGRRGVSRYTDIWLKRDGRWLCIAAHITPHKPLPPAAPAVASAARP